MRDFHRQASDVRTHAAEYSTWADIECVVDAILLLAERVNALVEIAELARPLTQPTFTMDSTEETEL